MCVCVCACVCVCVRVHSVDFRGISAGGIVTTSGGGVGVCVQCQNELPFCVKDRIK